MAASSNAEQVGKPFTLVAQLRTSEFDGGNRAEQVATQLETAIAVGLIGDGERLPPEPSLAAQLGVTMLNVRQALAMLRDRGLVETRRGRGGGSVVRDTNVVSAAEAERRLRERSTEALRDLGDLAGSAGAAAARLAAARADQPDITRLRNLVGQLEAADGPQQRRRADSRFHIELAVAAQSRRLTTATVQIAGERAPLLWTRPEAERYVPDVVKAHNRLVDAVADTDEQLAQGLAIEHNDQVTEWLIDTHLDLVLAEGV
ncbi:FadR/GntR family transcriptional regulator [Sciscionella sediminilitoris]|uniref:FadR/GntR family transcriptional regulator n=1 Tax=Sciscionella sediminilitoris TaxID=1445613 RepID=UPI00068A8705|nr:FCD domain-containing protein [Sciscionella sp. SE31]